MHRRILAILIVVIVSWTCSPGAGAGVQASDAPPQTETARAGGTRYLSLSAAAFRPSRSGYDYENHGRFLKHLAGPTQNGLYVAPVHLPHGATVTRMTFYFVDNLPGDAGNNAAAQLYSSEMAESGVFMATVTSVGQSGFGSATTTSISHAIVDNRTHTYWVTWFLPPPASDSEYAWGCGVTIEYEEPAPSSVGYVSLPGAAFFPFLDGGEYSIGGTWLTHIASPGGGTDNGWYLAPMYLPHGATVTRTTFYYGGDSIYPGRSYLQRTEYGAGTFSAMDEHEIANNSGGYTHHSDTTIATPTIDNSRYGYWVIWDLPALSRGSSELIGTGVVIEYTMPAVAHPVQYVSMPAAAFMPDTDGYDYENHGRHLIQHDAPGIDGKYLAWAPLPDGGVATHMTFYYRSNSGEVTKSELQGTDLAGYYGIMAGADTSGSLPPPWYGAKTDDTIAAPRIDNGLYAYHAVWKEYPNSIVGAGGTPDDVVWGNGVVIQLGARVHLPIVTKGP